VAERHSESRAGNDARRGIAFFAAFLVLGLIVAYLNRAHVEQQSNYLVEYVNMADHYRGVATRAVLTYPLWGYSFVLMALPRYDLVAIPQVVLSSLVATLLLLALHREMPEYRRATSVFFLAAAPWYLLHSVKWPQSFAASFCILGLVLLARALRRDRLSLGVAGGVAAGLAFGAALYFRSEFLYLPLFLVCIAVASRWSSRYATVPVAPALAAAVVASAALVPWAVHYDREAGRYSFTASQRGIVAFISLGQLPGNPWGATYLDEYAYDYLKARQIDVIPQSDSGDRVLYEEFKRRVREHPAAFAKKMVWNAAMTLASGFYSGEIPLTPDENAKLGELRSNLRGALLPGGEAGGGASDGAGARVHAALVYWAVAKMLGALYVTIGVAGLLVCIWRGIRSPLVLVLAGYAAYQLLLLLALATEPRYLNGLYLALVPFVIAAGTSIAHVWRRRRRTQSGGAVPA